MSRAVIPNRGPLGHGPGWVGSHVARRGDPIADPPLAAEPTAAPPGSLEKIEVMRERAERGEAVFHPGDARVVARVSQVRGTVRG